MPKPHNAKSPVGVVTCSTLASEVRACCQQLGIPARIHANQPACLFETARDKLDELVGRAARAHDQLLLAFGRCCGDADQLGRIHQAAALSAAECTELLVGGGTYGWCEQHQVLLLPHPYFSTWLRRLRRDATIAAAVESRVTAPDIKRIAAIDEGTRIAGAEAIADVEALARRRTTAIYTGLGHVRQALRAAAEDAGIALQPQQRRPVDPESLGPGDQLLILVNGKVERPGTGFRFVAGSLRRGVRPIWLAGEAAHAAFPPRSDELERLEASGELEALPAELVLAAAGAETDPQRLVDHWISHSLRAFAQGSPGICVIHPCGWGHAAELGTEYLLEYGARLSAACSRWPIMSVWETGEEGYAPQIADELIRTHPLTWDSRGVLANEHFRRTDEYLGGQLLLESLGQDSSRVACRDLSVLVSALADGELDQTSAPVVTEHVERCPDYQQLMTRSQEIRGALRWLRDRQTPVPSGFWTRVRAAMRRHT